MATVTGRSQVSELHTFIWTGKDKRGRVLRGEIQGKGEALVRADLRRQGLSGIQVRRKGKPLFGSLGGKPVKAADIAFFSRQIATMMASGVPLVQALQILSTGQKNPRFRQMVDDIKQHVEGGHALNEALQRHPVQFDELYVSLVKAGESAGVLDTILATIADYKERMESIKKKIKKALMYPAIVMTVAVIVTAVLLIYVIPQFEEAFRGFGAELPAFTLMVIGASKWMQAYGIYFLLGVIGLIMAIVYAKKRSRKVARLIDRILLKLPVIGPIMHKAALARFSRTLAITFRAGVPLVEALESVAGATGNIVYENATLAIRDEVATGTRLQRAMENTDLFPNMVIQMIAVGEESGALDEMSGKVASFYEAEVDNAVDSMSSLLEPLIMAILGVLVGGLVIAMYLPIFKLGAVV